MADVDEIPGLDPAHHPMRLLEQLTAWMDANDEHEHEPDPVDAPPKDRAVRKVSAWAGSGALADPHGYADFAHAIGLRRIDLMVNEHSAWRDPRPFDTYSADKIERFAEAVAGHGIELHLTSWLMPHADYIAKAMHDLLELLERTGAISILFDCEEPWTKARRRLQYSAAARLVRDAFAGVVIGVTGIGYAPVDKLGPICSVADYLVPQCYSTSTSKQDPVDVVGKFTARWRREWPEQRVEVGLAAYRQTGIPGYTADAAMRAAFAGAQNDKRSSVVIYWSLAALRKDKAAARTVAELVASIPA